MRPYVIWSPPWDHKVGGIRALYLLRDELRARGADAWLHSEHADPDAITVYPEIVQDNPLRATRIVRWLLNRARVPDDGFTYDWQPCGGGNPLLTVDLIDRDTITAFDVPRGLVTYVVRKGVLDPSRIPDGAVEITRTWPATHAETLRLLAASRYLISFDEFTLINLEALLLGTPVLLYPSGRWSRAEVEAQGWTQHGVAWSPDGLDAARKATAGAWPWYLAEVAQYGARIDAFMEETQARWPTCG